MLYFSELKNKAVVTEDRLLLGKLEDVIFLATETPKLTKLIVKNETGKQILIPLEYLNRIDHQIVIQKNYLQQDLVANELYVSKNLQDKQIIDLKGQKIVRVNDVVIQEQPFLYIAGVDIGFLGILRNIGLEKIINKIFSTFKIKIESKFLSWGDIQPIELAYGRVSLKKREEKLKKIRPEDMADYLEKTNILNVGKVLKILDDRTAADVINYLNINYQSTIFQEFPLDRAAKTISLLDPDEAVDVLLTLSQKKRDQILQLVDLDKKKEIEYLLKLSKSDIGSLITTEFLTVDSHLAVKEVYEKISKETSDFSFLSYVYAVNQENQIIGVVSLHELILRSLDTPIYKFMSQNLVVVHLSTPVEIALNKLFKYRLQALPVIDKDKKILGIVTIDDLGDILQDKLK